LNISASRRGPAAAAGPTGPPLWLREADAHRPRADDRATTVSRSDSLWRISHLATARDALRDHLQGEPRADPQSQPDLSRASLCPSDAGRVGHSRACEGALFARAQVCSGSNLSDQDSYGQDHLHLTGVKRYIRKLITNDRVGALPGAISARAIDRVSETRRDDVNASERGCVGRSGLKGSKSRCVLFRHFITLGSTAILGGQ
jgi:hypothetical protein